jgi:hypothetical protein
VLLAIPLVSAGWALARDLIALRQARHAARTEAKAGGDGAEMHLEPPPAEVGVPGGPAGA